MAHVECELDISLSYIICYWLIKQYLLLGSQLSQMSATNYAGHLQLLFLRDFCVAVYLQALTFKVESY